MNDKKIKENSSDLFLTIPEQEDFINKYTDCYNFIIDFVKLYHTQRICPVKVFPRDSKHFSKFQIDIIEYSLRISKNDYLSDVEILFDTLKIIRNDYFSFYFYSVKCLYKGINIYIEQTQKEVCKYDFHNLRLLYKYTLANIDLYPMLVDYYMENIDLNTNESKNQQSSAMKVVSKYIGEINRRIYEVHISTVLMDFLTSTNDNLDETTIYNNHEIGEKTDDYRNTKSMLNYSAPNFVTDDILDNDTNKAIEKSIYIPEEITNKASVFVMVRLKSQLVGNRRVLAYSLSRFSELLLDRFKSEKSSMENNLLINSIKHLLDEFIEFEISKELIDEIKCFLNEIQSSFNE